MDFGPDANIVTYDNKGMRIDDDSNKVVADGCGSGEQTRMASALPQKNMPPEYDQTDNGVVLRSGYKIDEMPERFEIDDLTVF